MANNIIDLHMHTLCSDDGEYTPTQLVDLCKQAGLKTIAITDHNSTKGIDEAQLYGKQQNINVIAGIEIDCIYNGLNLHVLGYHINHRLAEFDQLEDGILKQEQLAAEQRIALVEKAGIYVNRNKIKTLSRQGVVTGEMIAEASIDEIDNNNNPLIAPYRQGGSRSDNPLVNFYWDFCAQGKVAYIPIHYISLQQAIALINQAGGVSVLAHPGKNIHENSEILAGIISCGVQGIEVYSSYHSVEQISFYQQKAAELNCLVTCGSDFHGKIKPSIHLGQSGCNATVQQTIAEQFSKQRA